jgi:hypothetical protein
MAAGDTTIATFTAGDATAAKAAIEALGITGTDQVISWQQNNQVFVARIELA